MALPGLLLAFPAYLPGTVDYRTCRAHRLTMCGLWATARSANPRRCSHSLTIGMAHGGLPFKAQTPRRGTAACTVRRPLAPTTCGRWARGTSAHSPSVTAGNAQVRRLLPDP